MQSPSERGVISCSTLLLNAVFSCIDENRQHGGLFAGCNFWGWGGFARPAHEYWQAGDDYTGDPAQEQQGLNSVFAADESTLGVIARYAERLAE